MTGPTLAQTAPPAGDAVLVLRAAGAEEARVLTKITIDGAVVAGGEVIGWHRVLRVPSARTEEARPFLELGQDLWRAGVRLDRGDALTAEPLLEAQEPLLLGRRGPTASELHARLLSCRGPRGAFSTASRSWLAWRWASGFRPGRGTVDAPSTIDGATGLVPTLPPVFGTAGEAQDLDRLAIALPAALDDSATREQRVTLALAALYLHAARFDAGLERAGSVPSIEGPIAADPGVSLARAMVLGRAGVASERAGARRTLEDRIPGADEPWIEAWCRLGIGRSFLSEPDEASRELGVIELLHVPARFGGAVPSLAALALGEAIGGLVELGEEDAARVLAGELVQRYPRHPVLGRPVVRRMIEGTPGGGMSPARTTAAAAGGDGR